MIDQYERKKLNAGLKEISNKMKSLYNVIRQSSETEYRDSLKPYEMFKPQEGFYSEKHRQEYCDRVNELKAQARDLLADYSEELTKEYTKSPTAEAVNVVNLVNARKEISAEEIDNLMNRYGIDCPMVYNALKEKAISMKYLDFRDHPIKTDYDNMEMLQRDITRLDGKSIEQNPVISFAALNQVIDMAFPCEE
ncbi:MAG: hypothetical protein K6G45_13045 [Lachnospiraceae bacterium]|nr:hypothetical protein [Lachnospiraceae bacterium]